MNTLLELYGCTHNTEGTYKELLKFRTFVKTYYPNYHICPKCGELMPENDICLRCYANNDLELCKNIKHLMNGMDRNNSRKL